MNIVFLTRLFYPHIGGVEIHVLNISRLLVKAGHKVVIITELQEGLEERSSFAKAKEEREEIKGIEIRKIRTGKEDFFKKFRIWRQLWHCRNVLKKADIVHCHDVFFWYFPFRFLLFNKKVFTTFHGYEGKYPVSKKAIFVRKLSQKLSKGTINVGRFIEKWYGTKPNFITYGGVREIKDLREKIYDLRKKDRLHILFIGRLDEDTGILQYLNVLDNLKKRKVQFEFEVCGDGKFRRQAEQYGKVHGFVESTKKYIEKADYVFCSSYLSILEVLSYGRPIIAFYNNPLKKDYLVMTPFALFITISNSPKEVSEQIVKKNFSAQKISDAQKWAQNQTWGSVLNLYFKLWKK